MGNPNLKPVMVSLVMSWIVDSESPATTNEGLIVSRLREAKAAGGSIAELAIIAIDRGGIRGWLQSPIGPAVGIWAELQLNTLIGFVEALNEYELQNEHGPIEPAIVVFRKITEV